MSPLDLSRNRATEFRARGIPDRGHVSDPEAKRVLDALAENIKDMQKRFDVLNGLIKQKENVMAAKSATDASEEAEKAEGDESSSPVLGATKSIEIISNKIQFKNDSDPGPKYVYASNAAGVRGWMNMTTFVNEILGDALTEYLNQWMTNYIENTGKRQYFCTGVQYTEGTKTMEQVFVEAIVLGIVQGSTIVGNVYTAEGCP